MCLGVPGQIAELTPIQEGQLAEAKVRFGGLTRSVCVALVPEVRVGDYVLVHAGLALERIDAEDAERTLAYLRAMGESEEFSHEAS